MHWGSFLPNMLHAVASSSPPDALVIQLGENYPLGQKGVDLALAIMTDLEDIWVWLPWTPFFWSELHGRQFWSGTAPPDKPGFPD